VLIRFKKTVVFECILEKYHLRLRVDKSGLEYDQLGALVVFQLDAQNSYLFTYNTFLKILYMFREHCPVHLQEVYVVIVYIQPLVSSLCKM